MTRRIIAALSLALLSTACNDSAPTAAAPPADLAPAAGRLAPAQMRPAKFNVLTRVVTVSSSVDGRSRTSTPVVGARVRLLLLPLKSGDRVAPNAERYLKTDSVGTVATDSSGLVGFYNIDVTRFRVEVLPPAGSALRATSQEFAPPAGGTLHYDIPLRKR